VWAEAAAGGPVRRAVVITLGAVVGAAAGFVVSLVIFGVLTDSGQAGCAAIVYGIPAGAAVGALVMAWRIGRSRRRI
jgi:hypothetical protein